HQRPDGVGHGDEERASLNAQAALADRHPYRGRDARHSLRGQPNRGVLYSDIGSTKGVIACSGTAGLLSLTWPAVRSTQESPYGNRRAWKKRCGLCVGWAGWNTGRRRRSWSWFAAVASRTNSCWPRFGSVRLAPSVKAGPPPSRRADVHTVTVVERVPETGKSSPSKEAM